jgi:hypothetical protein
MLARVIEQISVSSNQAKFNDGQASEAIRELEDFIHRARSRLVIRDALNGCLIVPVCAKWKSNFETIDAYFQNTEKIAEILQVCSFVVGI